MPSNRSATKKDKDFLELATVAIQKKRYTDCRSLAGWCGEQPPKELIAEKDGRRWTSDGGPFNQEFEYALKVLFYYRRERGEPIELKVPTYHYVVRRKRRKAE